MIHAYHVIWGAYGFWLPNDPRGSWSDFVASWELLRFGKATGGLERRDVDPRQWQEWRAAAVTALRFPPVVSTGAGARGRDRPGQGCPQERADDLGVFDPARTRTPGGGAAPVQGRAGL